MEGIPGAVSVDSRPGLRLPCDCDPVANALPGHDAGGDPSPSVGHGQSRVCGHDQALSGDRGLNPFYGPGLVSSHAPSLSVCARVQDPSAWHDLNPFRDLHMMMLSSVAAAFFRNGH